MDENTKDEKTKQLEQLMTPVMQGLAQHLQNTLPVDCVFGLIVSHNRTEEGDGGQKADILWVSNGDRDDMVAMMCGFIGRSVDETTDPKTIERWMSALQGTA